MPRFSGIAFALGRWEARRDTPCRARPSTKDLALGKLCAFACVLCDSFAFCHYTRHSVKEILRLHSALPHPSNRVESSVHARFKEKIAFGRTALVALCLGSNLGFGQDLAPRAYVITPTGANAITVAYSWNDGAVFVDPLIQIQNLKVQFQTESISYYSSYNLWGRSSNITLILPYALGNAQGTLAGSRNQIYRSGMADSRIRFAVNLKGGPARSADDFTSWHEKGLIGVSATALIPTGQYDPQKLINIGTNRWGLKPEIGISRRWQRWVVDWYAGGWFFTQNSSYYPGSSLRSQRPIGAGEAHFTYYAKPRLWASLDANYWIGGRSTINGQLKADEQRNSRVGLTVAIPISRNQSIKLSYATGAYVTIGGNYRTLSAAWQYAWLGKHE